MVDSNKVPDVIELTKAIVRCPSVTPEDAGAQNVLIEPLKSAGFVIHDLPFEGRGSYPVKNFFARFGKGAPHFCYAGHTDVVPSGPEDKWTHPPFSATIDNGLMYGRGTSDMKAANTAFTVAALQFIGKHPDFDGSIGLLITGDEESEAVNGTVRVLEWMKDNNHIPDHALVGESSSIHTFGETLRAGRRGSLNGTVTVTGKQGHVANAHLADNPMPRLAEIALKLCGHLFDEGVDGFPATNLEITRLHTENTARNVVPMDGQIEFNIRFNTKWTADSLTEELKNLLNQTGYDYELQTDCNAAPFKTNDEKLISLVQDAANQVIGRTPEANTGGGTSDARFIAPYCPVVEFGLTTKTIHQIDENLVVEELCQLVKIYKLILENYFKVSG